MLVRNETKGTMLATDAARAKTFWSRLVGLLGRSALPPGEGLLIQPCSSVHTAFMRFPIDVVYLDEAQRVVKLAPRLAPFRASIALRGARSALEVPAGTIEATRTEVGDQLAIEGD